MQTRLDISARKDLQPDGDTDSLVFKIRDADVICHGKQVFSGLNLEIHKNQHLAVVGETGSGKSVLLKAMAGQCQVTRGKIEHHFSDFQKAAYLDIRHDFKPANRVGGFFYQQRFNAGYADDSPTVEEYLISRANNADADSRWTLESLYTIFRLESIRHRHLIKLSSGEGKRVRMAAAVVKNPGILLLDSPLAGLDEENRKIFENICFKIRSGERWALSGPNGSGKFTLLSLIYGDHPQAYADDIVLYDYLLYARAVKRVEFF